MTTPMFVVVARTHTVKLGTVLTMFALGVPRAFGVAFATIAAARAPRDSVPASQLERT